MFTVGIHKIRRRNRTQFPGLVWLRTLSSSSGLAVDGGCASAAAPGKPKIVSSIIIFISVESQSSVDGWWAGKMRLNLLPVDFRYK